MYTRLMSRSLVMLSYYTVAMRADVPNLYADVNRPFVIVDLTDSIAKYHIKFEEILFDTNVGYFFDRSVALCA